MPTSKASAEWNGGLKNGTGRFQAGSGAFSGSYSFSSRFEGTGGTNPEELMAAAHAACLSMALSAGLEKSGHPATSIKTTAQCTIDGSKITGMQLEIRGIVPGIDQAAFQQAAEAAKNGCPVSGALQGNVAMTLDAKLE